MKYNINYERREKKKVNMNILRLHRKSKNKKKTNKYILFIFSLIMTTFAWFAYSKVLNTCLDIHVAAWDMEYYIQGEKKENPIGVDFATLYPQMPEQTITVDIKNNGEAIVELDYHIESITIIGVTYEIVTEQQTPTTSNFIRVGTPIPQENPQTGEYIATGKIINDTEKFPFTLELEHSLQVLPKEQGYLTIKANWIGNNDELDSEWGYKVGKYFMDNPDATSAMSLSISIDSYQSEGEINSGGGDLPSTVGTRPYLPSSNYKLVEGTSLDTGLTIQDESGNQYVWIEVPKLGSTYKTAGLGIKEFTNEELEKIEIDLKTYAGVYRSNSVASDEYYSTQTTGLASDNYYELKNKMLKSVYQNGGFYIGKYEAGSTESRTTHSSISGLIAKSQPNLYPINWVTCSDAQSLATKVASGTSKTSSLMFGLQWDLVEKYIESKLIVQGSNLSAAQSLLKGNSTSWGNYQSTLYNLTNVSAKYSLNNGSIWLTNIPFNKTSADKIFLTTGAITGFAKQNISDFAGNVWEYTLEYSGNTTSPCSIRGGAYESTASENNANTRTVGTTTFSYSSVGFRVSIY